MKQKTKPCIHAYSDDPECKRCDGEHVVYLGKKRSAIVCNGYENKKTKEVTDWHIGDKIICYKLKAGWDEDEILAKNHLEIGKEYTLSWISVGGWHTNIKVLEIPDVIFNSVHFENYDEEEV